MSGMACVRRKPTKNPARRHSAPSRRKWRSRAWPNLRNWQSRIKIIDYYYGLFRRSLARLRPYQKGSNRILFEVGTAEVALEAQLDDLHRLFALGVTLGIGEGPSALGAAKSVFCERVFPNQSSFRLRHHWSVLCNLISIVSLRGQAGLTELLDMSRVVPSIVSYRTAAQRGAVRGRRFRRHTEITLQTITEDL